MFWIFKKAIRLTHFSGSEIRILRSEVVTVFDQQEVMVKDKGKDVVGIPRSTQVTIRNGTWYPVMESKKTVYKLLGW